MLVAGQRDPRGDPHVVTREFYVRPDQPVDIAIDVTAPATNVPPYARTTDFQRLLPDIGGGISSTLPPRSRPGLVVSFDPALPVTLQAFSAVQQLHERYGEKGLFVLGIARDDMDAAKTFALKNALTFTIACETATKAGALDGLNIENYGRIVLYDKDGSVVFRKARPRLGDIRELNRRVAAMLE
jgi:hypothetical protein